MHRYAMLIRKSDLTLLTFLNGGVEPPIKPKTYLVVELDSDSLNIVTTKIVTKRELLDTFAISKLSIPLLRLIKK